MALLDLIVQTGSINQAARQMKMSYKSAWSKIRSTEKHLGQKIVHSDRATGTRLTPIGEKLLRQYKALKKQCLDADDVVFEKIFNHFPSSSQMSAASLKDANAGPPIVSIVGFSGSGKTTILEKLVAQMTAMDLQVAVIKHDVHGFEMDRPGKDTWRHRQAGAVATIISSHRQIGLVMDAEYDHMPAELAALVGFADIIITEGYKKGPYPKLEVFRPRATGDRVPFCRHDSQLLALITDENVSIDVPVIGTGQIQAIADFLVMQFDLPAG